MDFYDWMLALHLLSVFAVATALVFYSVLVVSGRRMTTLEQTRTLWRVAPVGAPLIGAGMGLAFVFGVILALDSDEYELWDIWVIVGIVLWVLLGAIGRSSGNYYMDVQKVAEEGGPDAERSVVESLRGSVGVRLHLATIGLFLLLLLDMIFKPGPDVLFAVDRPTDVDLALIVHVLGAMILVGGLVTAAAMSVIGWRDESSALRRRSTMTLLAVALPGWFIMRIGAEWVYFEEGWDDVPDDLQPDWIGIGYITADLGGILLLIALILGGIGVRKDRKGGGGALLRISGVIAAVLVAIYVIAVWAMGGKPS